MYDTDFESGLHEIERRNLLYQTYTNYIDPTSIIYQHYQQKDFYSGQEKYLQKINKWVDEKQQVNKPLVLRSEAGVGVKSLLVNWEKGIAVQNSTKKEKTLVIMHFASSGSNCSNYFYAIYRIIIKLREALKLKQNVDLLQQKIRKYFAYWLDLCSSEIKRQLVIFCAQQIYDKIVVVIQGVNRFLDSQTEAQANIAFWLPQSFPQNIKVILTAEKNSQAIDHLIKIKCQVIDIEHCAQISDALFNKTVKKQTIYSKEIENKLHEILKSIKMKNHNFSGLYNIIEIFSKCLLIENKNQPKEVIMFFKDIIEKKLNWEVLKQINNIQELYEFLLKLWEDNLPCKGKVYQAFKYLCLSQKGFTLQEIILLTNISQKQWSYFQASVEGILINHKGLYSIKSTSFCSFILSKCVGDIESHEKIANALENTPNSIRKLQQQTYHLFVSNSYFKLKEMVSNIQNFLLLFNPNNKYQLSRYWQKLEEKGFDPVIEYNKAVEGFAMHYHPSDQNIFRIIVQVSRFLKQFSDFQTYETPNFRHPYIEGNKTQLKKIGLLKQLANLKIHIDNSFSDETCEEQFPQQTHYKDLTLEQQIEQLMEKQFPKQQSNINELLQTQPISPIGTKKRRRKQPLKILSDIQQLNVDVPMNREQFRNHYLESLKQFMKKEQGDCQQSKEVFFDVDECVGQTTLPQNVNYSFKKIKQNYKLRQVKPTLYYYKRWIWIQFPWVCISLNNNYSTTPQLCHQMSQDDTFQQEAKYTKQALIVAIDAKQKKKKMFSPKGGETQQRVSRFKCTFSSSLCKNSKFATNGFKSQAKFSMIADLSLNALTKQLEIRRKTFQVIDQNVFVEDGVKCQEDMKFITQRKQFQPPNVQGIAANQVLPKLKWVIKQHTNYEMEYIKSHIEEKKKKLNKIIYDNRKLAETYKQLKLKQTLNKKNHNEQEGQRNVRKNKILEQLEKKKQEVIKNFCKSLLQKERLRIILKLCSENKTRNEQYLTSLNYLLQNIKKMISWEKQNMKGVTEELQEIKLLQQKKNCIEAEKEKNQTIVENQAKNYLSQKSKLEQQIQNITSVISQDIKDQKNKLQTCLSGHIKNREQKNFAMAQQKKNKQLQEKLERVQKDYKMLQTLFEFQGFDFENAPKFKRLIEQNQRNKKLKIAYFESKNKLEQVMRDHQRLKQQCKKQPQFQNVKGQQLVCLKRMKSKIQVEHENKIRILLENISIKLGLKSKEQIIPTIKKKLQDMKENRKEKYLEIMDPQYQPIHQKFQLLQ